MTRRLTHSRTHIRWPLAAIALACQASTGWAGTVEVGNGYEAVWSLNTSYTTGWRTRSADSDLIGKGNGGTGSGYTASADQNFDKGDAFTKLVRVIGDVNISKDGNGLVLRGKFWDNLRLSGEGVPFGSPANRFQPGAPLDDSGFDTRLSKFNGAVLLDAYVYGGLALSQGYDAKIKFGQHVVNFGESVFVPGVNQYSVFDVNALRQPGTLLKEAILPVPQISANLGLPNGGSVEGFYQFQWQRTSIDGCGTYWSPSTALNCTKDRILVGSDRTGPLNTSFTSAQYNNGLPATAPLAGANYNFSRAADRTPSDYGQFGLAYKQSVEAIDTELGAYYVNYSTHTPYLSAIRDNNTIPGSVYYGGGATKLGSIMWDYSARNIKVLGLSASTVVGGWAVASELSYTKDFPVQINPVDLFLGAAGGTAGAGQGPVASRFGSAAAPLGSNTYLQGFDLKNKTQLQFSTLKVLPNTLGASSMTLLGEVAGQHWSGIGDPYTGVRYGRGFEFGAAQHATFGGACPAQATNASNCTQDGYFTSNAWGVRLLSELEYPNAIGDVTLKPRLFLAQDVKGWSADLAFVQNRRTVSLGLKAEFNKRYTFDLSYTKYNQQARFDSFHDRDFLGAVLSAAF